VIHVLAVAQRHLNRFRFFHGIHAMHGRDAFAERGFEQPVVGNGAVLADEKDDTVALPTIKLPGQRPECRSKPHFILPQPRPYAL